MLHKPSILLVPQRQILVVDDMADMCLLLKLRLERAGYLVATARRGSEVVQLIHQQGLPDLLLLDVFLPEQDGFAIATMVRQLGNVPLIFISAQSNPMLIAKARDQFAAAYVIKPFLFATLLTHIQHMLRTVSIGQADLHFT